MKHYKKKIGESVYDDGFEDRQSSNRFNVDKDNGYDECSNTKMDLMHAANQ